VYCKAKSEYGLRIKMWGGANRIPRILRNGEGVTREFSWKEVRDKKEAAFGNATIGEGVRYIRKKKGGRVCKSSY
jgi:hypothetical protein